MLGAVIVFVIFSVAYVWARGRNRCAEADYSRVLAVDAQERQRAD